MGHILELLLVAAVVLNLLGACIFGCTIHVMRQVNDLRETIQRLDGQDLVYIDHDAVRQVLAGAPGRGVR